MRRFVVIVAVVVFALAVSTPSSSVAEADTAASATLDQTMPALVYNPNPEVLSFLLVWIEDRGAGYDVYAKRLFGNGLPQGGASTGGWKVIRDDAQRGSTTPPRGPRADPAIVYNPALTGYMLVYSQMDDDETGWDVFSVRISAAGYAQGNPRRLAGGPGDQRRPDVAIVGDDRVRTDDYLVVWEDNARDADEVWARRVQANGIPRGAAYPLVRGSADASDPTTNGSAVAWVDNRAGESDIYTLRLRNGLPNGPEKAVTGDLLDQFNPRYGSGGLVWNEYDPMSGVDIMGIEVIENNLTRGGSSVILVPAADQVWPDMDNGVVVFADNRSGDYDLYAVRVLTGGRVRAQGHDYPVLAGR